MAETKETLIAVETRTLRIVLDESSRQWSLYEKISGDWKPIVQSAYGLLSLQDGRILRTDNRHASLKTKKRSVSDFVGKGKSLRITTSQEAIEFALELRIYEGVRTLTVQLQVANKSREPLRCNELNVFAATERGGVNFGNSKIIMSTNGYHSWSESDVFELDTSPQISHWHTVLYSPAKGESLLLGFLTNELAVNSLEVQRSSSKGNRLQVRTLSDLKPLEIKPGKQISSDRLLIQFGDSPLRNVERYSNLLHQFSTGKKKKFEIGKAPLEQVPTGWCSWYYYYQKVTETDVIENLEAADQHFRDRGFQYIQIDDGYQRASGDWDANDKFPHGHRWLTKRIHHHGFLAGLWLAPFAVGERSDLLKNHPDWLLKNPDGSPKKILSIENWGGDGYALDPTIHDVQKWLTDLFRKVTHKWGYDYVKIDFLYMGAHGTQYSQLVTPGHAYRMGLNAIRKGVGHKKFILGCGAPMGLSVGFVDGMRIGPDVEASWNGVLPAVAAAANRYYYHNKIWFDDPDCLVVREPLTIDQARVWASIVSLSGQMNLLSDNLRTLPPERIALLSKTLPVYEGAAVPVDLFEPLEEEGMSIRNAEGKEFRLSRSVQFSAGDGIEWKKPGFDDSQWETVPIPSPWEKYEGLENYDGYGWYRLRFHLPTDWIPSDLTFFLGRVDDCDETYLNGTMIGSTGAMPPKYQTAWNLFRAYPVPKGIVNWKAENVLAIRAYDGGGPGGLYSLRKLHLPRIWNLAVKKKFGEWNVVGVFNWENFTQRIKLPFEKIGLSPTEKFLVYELWGDEILGEVQDEIELELQPTSSRVLAIHKALDRPQVLSTSRHITQGAVDLKDLRWNQKKMTLEGSSVNLRRGDYTLTVWVPPGYKFTRAVTAVDYETTTISQSIVKVTLKLGKDKPLGWKLLFERTES